LDQGIIAPLLFSRSYGGAGFDAKAGSGISAVCSAAHPLHLRKNPAAHEMRAGVTKAISASSQAQELASIHSVDCMPSFPDLRKR
jgi:hypothetical protein